jgi:hypothetical protein
MPDVGQSVTLLDDDGREHRSQIHEASENGRLSVLRPPTISAGVPLLIGDEMTVTWPIGAGAVLQVQARLAAMRRIGEAQVWDIDPLGEPTQIQRRALPRAVATGAVTVSQILELGAPAAPRAATGSLIDVSEVAVRFSLEATEIWATRRGTAMRVSFTLDDLDYVATGRVIIAGMSSERREVVVLFDQPVDQCEELRSFVSRSKEDDERARS